MKRVLSVLLAVSMLLSVCVLHASAQPQGEYDADPVVFLLGYSTANLYYDDGVSEEKECVWNLTADGVVDRLVSNLPKVLWGTVMSFRISLLVSSSTLMAALEIHSGRKKDFLHSKYFSMVPKRSR